MRVVITGAGGNCGTALHDLPQEVLLTDLREPKEPIARPFSILDVTDPIAVDEALRGCEAVIHLAAVSDPAAAWDKILAVNIEGTRNILYSAAQQCVKRVIFASSNHVVGMYELDHAPQIYRPGHGVVVDHRAAVRPDSEYGASKVFGEALGRYLAESHGNRFIGVRIGSVRSAAEDHPYAYAEAGVRKGEWSRDSESYREQEGRLKAIWQSRRDFLQMIELCLEYDGPAFDVFYGTSDNAGSWLDIEHARCALGYAPRDSADSHKQPPELSEPVSL